MYTPGNKQNKYLAVFEKNGNLNILDSKGFEKGKPKHVVKYVLTPHLVCYIFIRIKNNIKQQNKFL